MPVAAPVTCYQQLTTGPEPGLNLAYFAELSRDVNEVHRGTHVDILKEALRVLNVLDAIATKDYVETVRLMFVEHCITNLVLHTMIPIAVVTLECVNDHVRAQVAAKNAEAELLHNCMLSVLEPPHHLHVCMDF